MIFSARAAVSVLLRTHFRGASRNCGRMTSLSWAKSRGMATESSGKLALTSERYKVDRLPFATLTESNVKFFEELLGSSRIITDADECESFNIDWIKTVRGASRLVVKPKTTEEVSAILRYCNDHRIAVCPQSGNTGLVGGSNPVFDEVVLSMRLMNQVIETDELAGTVVCQAGCVLENLDTHLQQHDLMMPLDLGAKGSCLIGGCVSTNAGGLRLLRYGNLHGTVLGLEAVKADGEVIDCLNTLKKNNTGYHLKHLFIGSEGTLGVVTKVSIKCPTLPKAVHLAYLGTDSFQKVLKTFHLAQKELGEVMSACEVIDRVALESCTRNLGLRDPLSSSGTGVAHDFYVIVETSGSNAAHDEEKLTKFLEMALDKGIINDGTMSSEPTKVKNMWHVRERLAEALLHDGYLYKYDVSLPLEKFYEIVEVVRERVKHPSVVNVNGFGHLGDGNLHMQVCAKQYEPEITAQLEPFVYEYVSKVHGSISAEHGIGFKKAAYLSYSKTPSEIRLMQQLKRMMDPNGILNPYKVLYPM